MKKFGLIGAGGYASLYVVNFLELKEKRLIDFCGVVIRHPEKIPDIVQKCKDAGVRIYPDKDSMYADNRLDVVAIPSSIGSHCALTVEALEREYNVIVEKPAAGSLAEVNRMIEAEKRAGKFVTVGFQHIYATDIRNLKRMILDGKFGKIRKISVMGLWPRANSYYQRNNWVCKLHGANGEPVFDSPINNAFAHYLNLSLFFAGDCFEKSAHAAEIQAELYRARREIETFDTCGVRIKTTGRVNILCLFSHACAENRDPVLKIECENAEITWSEAGSWFARMTDGSTIVSEVKSESGRKEMFQFLVDKAEGKDCFACPLTIAREHTFVIEYLHQHFEPVDIPESQVTIRPDDGQHIIRNISDIFNRCFAEGKLPSENGIRWR